MVYFHILEMTVYCAISRLMDRFDFLESRANREFSPEVMRRGRYQRSEHTYEHVPRIQISLESSGSSGYVRAYVRVCALALALIIKSRGGRLINGKMALLKFARAAIPKPMPYIILDLSP